MLHSPRWRIAIVLGLAVIMTVVMTVPMQAALFDSPVPNPSCGTAYYTVVRHDTLYRISVRFGTTVSTLLQCNNIASANLIRVGQRLLVPATTSPTAQYYTVVKGDTLWKIAQKTGVSTFTLISLNGLRFPYLLRIGQVLRIR